MRRYKDVCWPLHRESFVRPLVIELLDKLVEANLLLEKIRTSGPCCLALERAVHALVTTVFLGMCWPNPLQLNAELEPEDRELR